jgi:predicted signal transduction protein with EAL and GGDEF domain
VLAASAGRDGEFIGVAEAHGIIDDLTRVVLDVALAQIRRWEEAGLKLRVAINVSMDNLASEILLKKVSGILAG